MKLLFVGAVLVMDAIVVGVVWRWVAGNTPGCSILCFLALLVAGVVSLGTAAAAMSS